MEAMKKISSAAWFLQASMVIFVLAVAIKAQSPLSVKEGVYTAAQADRGEKVFKQSCASCHALEAKGKVSGDAPGPDLAGEFFLTHEAGNSVWTITKVIKDTMP